MRKTLNNTQIHDIVTPVDTPYRVHGKWAPRKILSVETLMEYAIELNDRHNPGTAERFPPVYRPSAEEQLELQRIRESIDRDTYSQRKLFEECMFRDEIRKDREVGGDLYDEITERKIREA